MKSFIAVMLFFFSINVCFAEEINDLDIFEVTNFSELMEAINSEENEMIVILNDDIVIEQKIIITTGKNVSIVGNDYTLLRSDLYVGTFFEVSKDSIFTIDSLTIDGGASGWKLDYDSSYFQKENNKGVVYTPVIDGENDIIGNSSIIKNSGSLYLKEVNVKNIRTTVSGAVVNGVGNINISNSRFEKIFSSASGGALYISGGETEIVSSVFKECMVGLEKKSMSGGAIYAANTTLNISDNTLFENNYSSSNGGAIYLKTSSLDITDSTFKGNKSGNDGAAIVMIDGTAENKIKYENVVFEDNFGLANTGQSLGIIYLTSWETSQTDNEDDYIKFINVEFKGNKMAAGSIADLYAKESTILFENCKIYDNDTNGAAAIFTQGANYIIRNTDIYNNYGGAYGVIRVKYGPASFLLDNVNIYNNETPNYGGALAVSYGNVIIRNSRIYNNKTGGNGTIFINSVDNSVGSVSLTLENTIIIDNESNGYGGGIYIEDDSGLYSTFVMDEKTKVYNNKSSLAGDDFVYVNKNEQVSSEDLLLNDPLEYGVNGIDNWYYDAEINRYRDIDIPVAYIKNSDSSTNILYLKAAGDVELSYDLNGGTSQKIYEIEYKKYGNNFDVTDDKPIIANGSFVGWNTKIDGSGHWYYDVDEYNGEYGKVLYAQYKFEEVKQPEVTNPDTLSGDIITMLILGIILSFSTLTIYINSGVKLK